MPQTPWGELSIGDAHVHFFSHNFYAGLARQKKVSGAEALAPLLQWDIPSPDAAALASRWVAELDRYGVTRAALIASVPGDEQSVSAAVAAHPDRFFGYFMIDPTQPDAIDRDQSRRQRILICIAYASSRRCIPIPSLTSA